MFQLANSPDNPLAFLDLIRGSVGGREVVDLVVERGDDLGEDGLPSKGGDGSVGAQEGGESSVPLRDRCVAVLGNS